jgi:excisionase family DNA binding protein
MDRNLTVRETCEAIGVSRPTLNRLLKAELISCYRVGTGKKARILFAPEHINEFLKGCERPRRINQ